MASAATRAPGVDVCCTCCYNVLSHRLLTHARVLYAPPPHPQPHSTTKCCSFCQSKPEVVRHPRHGGTRDGENKGAVVCAGCKRSFGRDSNASRNLLAVAVGYLFMGERPTHLDTPQGVEPVLRGRLRWEKDATELARCSARARPAQ